MLNNIKISQTTNEIILKINVIADIKDILDELDMRLPKLKEFYQTAEIPIRITGRLFTDSEIEKVTKKINQEINVEIKFDDMSDLLGLHAIKKTFETETDISETKYVLYSLRSGQKEEYPGSIVIIGDVNPGAEIIAGGNIVVLGALRGVAHAGATGNRRAIISANYLDVTQIRIANLVREIGERADKYPICKIEKNEIIII